MIRSLIDIYKSFFGYHFTPISKTWCTLLDSPTALSSTVLSTTILAVMCDRYVSDKSQIFFDSKRKILVILRMSVLLFGFNARYDNKDIGLLKRRRIYSCIFVLSLTWVLSLVFSLHPLGFFITKKIIIWRFDAKITVFRNSDSEKICYCNIILNLPYDGIYYIAAVYFSVMAVCFRTFRQKIFIILVILQFSTVGFIVIYSITLKSWNSEGVNRAMHSLSQRFRMRQVSH